jgi:chromosome segregation ATPase
MSNKNKPATSADNATPEQLQAALVQLRSDLAAATAQNADLQQTVQGLQTEKSELMRANQELAAEVNSLVDAREKAQSKHAGAGTHVRVSSAHKAGQHYRAGRLWTRDATDVHKDDFTAEQLAAMRADPQLVVVAL